MKTKNAYLGIVIILLLIISWFFIRFILGGNEDTWIKDEKGIWIKHGNPSETPDYVTEQQNAVSCALNLYNEDKNKGTEFSSQCLGICGNYAVDVVHVPRTKEDNLVENQCEAYKNNEVNHFIELDKDGNIVRIV